MKLKTNKLYKLNNKMKNLLIFGSGDNAKVLFYELVKIKNIKVLGFIDNNKKIGRNVIKFKNKKYNIIAKDTNLKKFVKKNTYGIISILDNKIRKKIYNKISLNYKNFNWFSLVSKSSIVSENVIIGDGSYIGPGVIINSGSRIGLNCFINTGSVIEHDNIFGNFVSTGPRIVTAGNVFIKDMVYLGMGTIVKEKVIIENNVFIGAVSFVNKNCKKNNQYMGIPAKKIKNVRS